MGTVTMDLKLLKKLKLFMVHQLDYRLLEVGQQFFKKIRLQQILFIYLSCKKLLKYGTLLCLIKHTDCAF